MGYIVLSEEHVARFNDDKLNKYLSRANRSGQKARDLIQQMLTFSRGQRGEPRPLSLGPLVKESIKLLEASLPSTVEIHMALHAATQVMFDPLHLEQILMNLCLNARDAVNSNGLLHVSVAQHECVQCTCDSCKQSYEGAFVDLSVRDNGAGIDANVLERMFEPFFTTKETGKGSGMGLSMVHGIVHEHGGHIRVDSEPGNGTALHVLLPALADEAKNSDNAATKAVRHSKYKPLSGRVLLVDDEEDVAEFMQDLLESWGLHVRIAGNGVHAMEVLQSCIEPFDLVITDYTMPKMTGLELAGAIRSLPSNIPIILYTGYSEKIENADIKNAGVNKFMSKPVDIDRAYHKIRQLLDF